jgi:hypothetical protein
MPFSVFSLAKTAPEHESGAFFRVPIWVGEHVYGFCCSRLSPALDPEKCWIGSSGIRRLLRLAPGIRCLPRMLPMFNL